MGVRLRFGTVLPRPSARRGWLRATSLRAGRQKSPAPQQQTPRQPRQQDEPQQPQQPGADIPSASGVRITVGEFQAAFTRIKQSGFVPTMRRGPTGVGHTFEQLLGLRENSVVLPDLGFAELKAHRLGSINRITLFTYDRGVWLVNPLDAVKRYCAPDARGRLALNCTVAAREPNSAGLLLLIDAVTVQLRHASGVVLAAWRLDDLSKQFAKKFPALVLVSALAEKREGVEHFHYTRARLLAGTSAELFREQLLAGNIIVDLRLTDQGAGGARNHGTAFRVLEEKLPLLFKSVREL